MEQTSCIAGKSQRREGKWLLPLQQRPSQTRSKQVSGHSSRTSRSAMPCSSSDPFPLSHILLTAPSHNPGQIINEKTLNNLPFTFSGRLSSISLSLPNPKSKWRYHHRFLDDETEASKNQLPQGQVKCASARDLSCLNICVLLTPGWPGTY